MEIEFEKKLIDFSSLSKILLTKGFVMEGASDKSSVLPVNDRSKVVVTWVQQGPYTTPSYHEARPGLFLGRVRVLQTSFQNPQTTTILVGLKLDSDPFRDPQGLLRNIEDVVSIIRKTLETDFELDLGRNASSIILRLNYKATGSKDARRIIRLIEKLPSSSQFVHYTGRKVGETIELFPIRTDRSLISMGIVEVVIRPMNGSDYNVQFEIRLSNIDTFHDNFGSGEDKSCLLIHDLEDSIS